jgi:regulator of sigma E protease
MSSPAPEPAKKSPAVAASDLPVANPLSDPWKSFRFWAFLIVVFAILIPFGIVHGASATLFALITFLEVVLLFNILIIVHELGHFLAAKWCGLKIDKFAIWFGHPLWSRKVDGVEYVLGTIPAGGYVALPQMAPMEAIEGKSDTPREELPPASPWQKIVVAFAGPLFSFALALFFACIVWVVGKPVTYGEGTTTIGFVEPKYPAAMAGLLPGDKIISIDDHPITHFMGMGDSVIWRIVTSTADTIPVVVDRNGETKTFNVSPQKDVEHDHHWYERGATRKIGVGPADGPLVIKKLTPFGPAEAAGLKPGDQLMALNGQALYSYQQINLWLKDHEHDAIKFTVLRDGKTQDITVTPAKPVSPSPMPAEGPSTDLGFNDFEPSQITLLHQTPWQQVIDSVNAVVGTISALFASHSSVGVSQLSGPVGIMNILFAVLSSDVGWRYALWLAVLINVNLAMLNLLPLPVLDGGHIALSVIEWIRRRPLSMSILEPLQTACALVLIGYMVFITFFDVQDSGRMLSSGGEIKFAPKQSAP